MWSVWQFWGETTIKSKLYCHMKRSAVLFDSFLYKELSHLWTAPPSGKLKAMRRES